MLILVTGASGFIGRHLCTYLRQNGHHVRRSVRIADGLPDTVVIDDASSAGAMAKAMIGVECLIHLAAAVHERHDLGDPDDDNYQEVNVAFTRRLAEAAHASGVRRMVFVSSIKVCGESSAPGGLNEDTVGYPVGSYARSKWLAEQELRRIEGETGLDVVIVRPPLVYGPNVRANFRRLLSVVYAGLPLPFSSLRNRRSLLYIGNLVSALEVCATHPLAAGASFNVSDRESITLAELVRQLSGAMGKAPRLIPCPPWLLRFASLSTGQNRQIERLGNNLEVDARRISARLGWRPDFSFEQGIRTTVDWYLESRCSPTASHPEQPMASKALAVCQLCAVDFTLRHLLLPLIDGMRAEGWRITSVCSDGRYVADLRQRGYQVRTVAISRNLFNFYAHLKAVWYIFRLCRREKFDILHVHTPIAALVGRIAGKLARVPLVIYTAHGFYFHQEMPEWKYRFFVFLERCAGRLTDYLFTQSSEDAKTAVDEGIVAARSVTAIGNGASVDLFVPDARTRMETRAALGMPADAFVIGVIARLVKEKGLGEFLEAARKLGTQFPHVHFLLVGERLPSDHNASVESELRQAKEALGNRLIATGYRADVVAMLGAMDLFCLPSYREGLPRSIIEAMLMALPVVATDIRGAREEVVPDETGLLVPTRDAAALARALAFIVENPERGRLMGAAGRKRALELYDERQVVARQIEVIQKLLVAKGWRLPEQTKPTEGVLD